MAPGVKTPFMPAVEGKGPDQDPLAAGAHPKRSAMPKAASLLHLKIDALQPAFEGSLTCTLTVALALPQPGTVTV